MKFNGGGGRNELKFFFYNIRKFSLLLIRIWSKIQIIICMNLNQTLSKGSIAAIYLIWKIKTKLAERRRQREIERNQEPGWFIIIFSQNFFKNRCQLSHFAKTAVSVNRRGSLWDLVIDYVITFNATGLVKILDYC